MKERSLLTDGGESAPLFSAPPRAWSAHSPAASWTDSPWLWTAVFAYAGLVWLVAFGPKYALRQEMIERRVDARSEVARRMAAGEQQQLQPGEERLLPEQVLDGGAADAVANADTAAEEAEEGEDPTGLVKPLAPHKLRVSLTPLMFALAAVLEIAVSRLVACFFCPAPPADAPR